MSIGFGCARWFFLVVERIAEKKIGRKNEGNLKLGWCIVLYGDLV